MSRLALLFFMLGFGASAQNLTSRNLPPLVVDDKTDGYILFAYVIPSDGDYTFTVDGGLIPRHNSTIYYYEYLFELASGDRSYRQEHYNIGSQAQDGNICYFQKNEKNNRISGSFRANELVEMKLVMRKSDVNGEPHKKSCLIENTLVSVEKATPALSGK